MTDNDLLDPNVPLHCLRLDGGTQSRAAMDDAAIAEYSEAIRQGATLPPLIVYYDSVDFWLADGFHRYHAYRAAGVEQVMTDVRTGSKRDAVLFSVGANAAHGLRRTNEDKRRAVETLLADAEWAAWTDVAIAKACGVSSNFVGDVRRHINPINVTTSAERTYTTKHGTTATMKTANIGKAKPAEPPATEASDPATDAPPDPVLAKARPVEIPGRLAAAEPDGPAPAELDALRAENAALLAELDDLKADLAETLADNEMMGRVFDADDKVKASMDEARRQKALADNAERTLAARSQEFNERARNVVYWKKRAEKAERELEKAA
jgi:hypothetical protein